MLSTRLACTRRTVKDKGALMQTSAHLRFDSSLRAVSPGAKPPADGVPVRRVAPDQEVRPAFPNASRPTCAVGWRAGPAAGLMGTCPRCGAVPRDQLQVRVCRGALVRQTAAPFLHSARCLPGARDAGGAAAKRRTGSLADAHVPALSLPGLTSPRDAAYRSGREGCDTLFCEGARGVCLSSRR